MKTHMITTPRRETVTVEVDPQITHKASGIAASRGITTAEVLAEWLEAEFQKLTTSQVKQTV